MRHWKFLLGAVFASAILAAACAQLGLKDAVNPSRLAEAPHAAWPTNGGNLLNQRYSTLDTINKQNVGQLRGVWRASLGGSGAGPGFSAEAQTLAQDGVLYVVTGANDAFAIDVETGKTLWKYQPRIDLKKTVNVCCGWLSRGLGMGEIGRAHV